MKPSEPEVSEEEQRHCEACVPSVRVLRQEGST